jgi:hypothetical protein
MLLMEILTNIDLNNNELQNTKLGENAQLASVEGAIAYDEGEIKFKDADGVRVLLNDTDISDDSDFTIDGDKIPTREAVKLLIGTASTSGNAEVVYYGSSPSNVTVGGVPSGTNLYGRTVTSILEDIFVTYLSPSFSSFSISGQSNTIEVGSVLSGSRTFTWVTSNSSNVQTNSVQIKDVTSNTVIASGLANDGSESVNIGTISNAAPMSRAWRAEAVNTNSTNFNSSNFTVTSIYPYFYGKSSSAITANQTLVSSGTKVIASSTGTITITYNSASNEKVWFAIPSTSTSKTVWYVNALNNGSIGGAENFIRSFELVEIDSPSALWSDVNYKIYIANYPSAVTTIEFRNS